MRLNIFMKYVTLLGLVILLISCSAKSPCVNNQLMQHTATFWQGLWHGFTIIFSLLGKIFASNSGINENLRTGFHYWLGYFVGIVLFVKLIAFIIPPKRNPKISISK